MLKRPSTKLDGEYKSLNIMCSTSTLQNIYQTFFFAPDYADSIIRKFLFGLKNSGFFDYVLIDTSVSLSHTLGQFMIGSDYLLVPLPPSDDAMDGAE